MCTNVSSTDTYSSLFPVLLIPAQRLVAASGGGGPLGGFGVPKTLFPVLLIPATKG